MDSSDPYVEKLEESYDRVAEEYAERLFGEFAHKPIDRGLLDAFGELVGDKGTVADVGCGPGHLARYLHERGLPVVGIDISERMAEVARRLNPGLEFRQGNMTALPETDGAWAGIAAFYSIIHLRPEERPVAFR